MREMLRIGALLGAVAFVGCGTEVGNDGAVVGGSCVISSECADESVCRTGEDFPGGYCANACDVPEDCPSGSVCADVLGGICLVSCAGESECRTEDGYVCAARAGIGVVGDVMVCLGP